MKKVDIIEKLSDVRAISRKEATEIVSLIFDTMIDGLYEDRFVDYYGFGKFTVEDVPERTRVYTMGENKGQEYTTPRHNKVKFKPAKALREAVN